MTLWNHCTLVLHPGYEQLHDFMLSLPQRFAQGDGQLIHNGRNQLRRISYQGTDYVVKSFRRPNLINRWVYGLLRPSKALRAYRNALLYQKVGVGTPQPVGYLNIRRGLAFDQSYFVTLTSPCPWRYEDLFTHHFDYADDVLREIGRTTAVLSNYPTDAYTSTLSTSTAWPSALSTSSRAARTLNACPPPPTCTASWLRPTPARVVSMPKRATASCATTAAHSPDRLRASLSKYSFSVGADIFYCSPVKRKQANGLKHPTQALNSSTKLKHPTQVPNASSNGGDASRVGKRCSYCLVEFVFPFFLYSDAGRVAPISGSVSSITKRYH